MLNEAHIIDQLQAVFPNHIGDDAAIIPFSKTDRYVISKDLLVESIHFNCTYCDPINLANKCLQVNLSDLAAMGAKPQYILLGLSIPDHYQTNLPIFLKAFTEACQRAHVELIGGDTTRSPNKLFLSITAIGTAKVNHIKYRSDAKPGDIICVVGQLGHAHLGLQALETNTEGLKSFKTSLLNPIARVAEGLWLAKHTEITAMMDLSDGLLIDLEKLCQRSQVAGIIHCHSLPQSTEFTIACQTIGVNPLNAQLTGGEDYSLLITITPSAYQAINKSFQQQFDYPLTQIGVIAKGHNIQLIQGDQSLNRASFTPFSHFGELP